MAKQGTSNRPAGQPEKGHGGAAYVRFSLAQRIEHVVLLVSFTLLAVTGLPQKFAGSGIAEWLIQVFGGIESIRNIHHISAIVFILMSVYDLVVTLYKIFVLHTELSMLPGVRDITDAVGIVRYNLGLTKERPQLPRYSYEEKAEYWAMLWGTVIMAITGFMLWNPIMFTKAFPGELIPAAKAAHGAEALLAVLAIIVWHFYNVHIKSWNTAMWSGKLSEHHMAVEHGEELERIKRGEVRPRPEPAVIRQRTRAFVPVAALISVVMLGGVYWLATAEKTAIVTVPTPAVTVFVPLAPTPQGNLPVGLTNAQIGRPIPHPVQGREQCDTCHGPNGTLPYPADHAGRPNVSCLVCHSPNPSATSQAASAGGIATIPHPLEGRQDCLMCHKQGGVAKAIPADHTGRANDTCTGCHKLDPGISGTPAAAQGGTSSIAPIPANHLGRGPETCVACHAPTSSIRPAPADHAGRTGDTCAACHKAAEAAGAVGTPAAGTPAPGAAATPAAASGPAPIPADHAGRGPETCAACHAPTSTVKPAPADHAGRAGDTCAACHKPTEAGASGTAPAGSGAPTVSHVVTGAFAKCDTCHNPTGLKPLPADHAGRAIETCVGCHKPSG